MALGPDCGVCGEGEGATDRVEQLETGLRDLLKAIRNASVGKRGLLGQPVHVALRKAESALGEMVTADEDL